MEAKNSNLEGFSTVNGLVPMRLAVLIQRGKHDGQDDGGVVADQGHDVLVVPVVQGALGHLKVRAGDALGQLVEERHHHLLKLCWLNHIQNLF